MLCFYPILYEAISIPVSGYSLFLGGGLLASAITRESLFVCRGGCPAFLTRCHPRKIMMPYRRKKPRFGGGASLWLGSRVGDYSSVSSSTLVVRFTFFALGAFWRSETAFSTFFTGRLMMPLPALEWLISMEKWS